MYGSNVCLDLDQHRCSRENDSTLNSSLYRTLQNYYEPLRFLIICCETISNYKELSNCGANLNVFVEDALYFKLNPILKHYA